MPEMNENKASADIAVVGLAVMGQNLVLNFEDRGWTVAVFNRTWEKTREFVDSQCGGKKIIAATTLAELALSLKRPRKILLMVKAGSSVDDLIAQLQPHLETGDIILDGGNSHFPDTDRRCTELRKKGIHFIGAGISGGEEGARHGPSIMPGGEAVAWPAVAPMLQGISAKVGSTQEACCEWIGTGGSGHYVKMVHNGIEYGDMQVICEVYDLLLRGLGLPEEKIAEIFSEWNKTELESYLIEITSRILSYCDGDQKPFVRSILDTAGQKGTGLWAATDALQAGIPLTLIAEAVFARNLSSSRDLREKHAALLGKNVFKTSPPQASVEQVVEWLRQALYASKIISYAQGFMLMRQAALTQGWQLHFGNIAMVWRGGCIIRSRFLGSIRDAFARDSQLPSLLLDPFFEGALKSAQQGWRSTVQFAAGAGIPVPCLSAALSFYDGICSERLPANLLQAQRDFFGAHTYERVDRPRGEFYHNLWNGDSMRAESRV